MNLSRFFAFFIAFSVLLSTCGGSIVFLGFELNKSEISKTLCVKKNVAGNTCKGKCHLKKQLDQEHQREAGTPAGNLEKFEINYCDVRNDKFTFSLSLITEFYTHYPSDLLSSDLDSIFHPPLV